MKIKWRMGIEFRGNVRYFRTLQRDKNLCLIFRTRHIELQTICTLGCTLTPEHLTTTVSPHSTSLSPTHPKATLFWSTNRRDQLSSVSSPFPKVIFATKGKKTDHKNTAMIRTRVASVSSSRPGPTTSAEAPASRYVSRPVLTFFCDRCGATGYHNIDLCQPHHCSIVPHTSPRHHRWYT